MAFGETIAADEAQRFAGFADEIADLQRARAAERGTAAGRALHLKQHLGAVGELLIKAPETARSGVFGMTGKSWPVYVRFSNGSSRYQSDSQPDPRGFALKLVGVPGKKLIPGLEQELTQDFLFIDTPAIPFRTPDEFMQFVRAAKDGPGKLLPRLIKSFGFSRAMGLLWGAVSGEKVKSFSTHAFHTAAPIAFGKSAAKLALVPAESNAGTAPEVAKGDDFYRLDLSARLARAPLSWTLRAQLFVDEASTPIEDASVVWSAPWVDLATLTLPRQDPESARGREISELVSQLSFDPWHAIEEHRPLGAIMRARGAVYGKSVTGRHAAPEPKSVLTVQE
ncbi:MAG TPA: catalase [Polyangiaceae bacterium]|nr:catalase [Polyangiaceae bacterium]